MKTDKHIAWMAWRNLVSKKRRSGLSFMTIVSIFGVAIGVATLIIVLSVMGGFEQDLQRKMLSGEPHLEINAENALAGFSLKELPLAKVRTLLPEVTDVESFIRADVVLKHRKHLQSAELFGVDPTLDKHLWVFSDTMVEGKLSALGKTHNPVISEEGGDHEWPGIILGEVLAGNLGVDIGDEIIIINPQASDSKAALEGVTTMRHYVLVGTFRSGSFNYDGKWAVVSLDEARKFMTDYEPSLDEEAYVTGIAVNLQEPQRVSEAILKLKDLKGLKPLSWEESNKSLLFALKLEKFAMGSILMLIVVVAAFSISGTMMMTVFHKRTQVSLLRAIGMTQADIVKLYLMHGFTIGTVGIVLGLLGGLSVCFLIYKLQFIPLPAGVYYLKSLPVRFLPFVYFVICFCGWLFTLLASVYPALTASRQSPSLGLRYE